MKELKISIGVVLLIIIMPIHWLAVAIDFIAYAIGCLYSLITGNPRPSFSEYMREWW